jgi:hypothetical protein
VALFRPADLPWDALAFPSVHWALQHFEEVRGERVFAPRANPPDALEGLRPPGGG